MFDTVVRLRGELGQLVAGLDPHAVSATTARALWDEFNRMERLAGGAKTLLAGRVARTHQPARSGRKSAAEDLARESGIGTGTAADAINTSERLTGQPGVAGALRRGDLSAAQAAAISDAAASDPAAETRLVKLAGQTSLAALRAECLRVKAAADPDPDATHRRIHDQRRLRRWTDPEGAWNLSARGTADQGAAFNAALDPIIDQIFRQAHQEGRREAHEAYAFDAFIHLADHATGRCTCPTHAPSEEHAEEPADEQMQHPVDQPTDVPGGDAPAAPTGDDVEHVAPVEWAIEEGDDARHIGLVRDEPDEAARADTASDDVDPVSGAADRTQLPNRSGHPGVFGRTREASACPVRPTTNPRYLALLRVDAAALRRGQVQGEELCEISGVGPVPVSVARRLLGDAVLKLVITRGVDVLNVTHLGRGPTAAQRAALLWASPTCTVLGCHRMRVEIDHRVPWAISRHTRLDELDPLCDFHHDLRTRLGYALVQGVGRRALVPPDDPRHPNNEQATAPMRQAAGVPIAPQPAPPEPGSQRREHAQQALHDLLVGAPRAP